MWAAFKALTWQVKLAFSIGLLAILAALIGSTAYVSYQRGLNVSKIEIQKYETSVQRIQAAAAKIQSSVDVKSVIKYRDRVEYIDRVQYKTKTIVEQSVPEQFHFSKGWVYAYNQSVRGVELDPVLASDKSPASITDMRALADTIAPNNGICLTNQAKLDSLQQWIKDTDEGRKQATDSK